MTIEEAEELFKKYNCNLFFLSKSDDAYLLSWYEMLRISKEQEDIWTEEYILERCDMIRNDVENASKLFIYFSLFDVIINCLDSKKLYILCEEIIDTMSYAAKNLNPYERMDLAKHICCNSNKSENLFINILNKADKHKSPTTDETSLIDKFSEKMNLLLNFNEENTNDYFDQEKRDAILSLFNTQLNEVKSGNQAKIRDWNIWFK